MIRNILLALRSWTGIPLLIMVMIGLWASPAVSASPAAEKSFALGVRAFQAGDMEAALIAFERARLLGITDSRVFYNLGVVNYRLQRFGKAKADFEWASRFADAREVSWYNLGLVAAQQGRLLDAIEWFEQVKESAAPESVKGLARDARNWVGGLIAERAHPQLRLSSGYNSNPTALNDATQAPDAGKGSAYLDALMSYDTRRVLIGSAGIRATTTAYYSNYFAVNEANSGLLSVGTKLDQPLGGGLLDFTLQGGRSWYGGNVYQDFGDFLGRYGRRFGQYSGSIAYQQGLFESREGADAGLEGSQKAILASFGGDFEYFRFGFGFRHETNYRDSPDFSPDGNEATVNLKYLPSRRNVFEIEYTRRDRRYPLNASIPRKDNFRQIVVQWKHLWANGVFLQTVAQDIANDSSAPDFTFRQQIYSAGFGLEY